MKRIVLLMLSLVMVTMAGAEGVTQEDALQQARSFVQKREAAGSRMRRTPGTPQLTLAGKMSGLYVFNIANEGGFVIVSNDDRTTPILGFSDSGSLNPDQMPENMRAWLQGYADEIAWLERHNVSIPAARTQRRDPVAKADIAPLVTTTWNQGTPYNNLCPEYTSGRRAVTGCVATAMAQVMYYTETLAGNSTTTTTAEIPAYQTGSYKVSMPAIAEGTTINWADMLGSYSGGAGTDAQKTAVAQLMLYCGCSVKMNYGPSSGASSVMAANALKSYFGYSETTQYVSRSFYTYANWIELMYNELSQNRPVLYGGQSSGGGHEFVCDGYKYESSTDYFHINWGWGGSSDNYFVLSALNPHDQGIGGSSTDDGYNFGQDAIVGIQKIGGTGTVLNVASTVNLTLNSITLSKNVVAHGETVTITVNVTNNSDDPYGGELRLVVNGGLGDGKMFTIPAHATQSCDFSFTPSGSGTYVFKCAIPNDHGGYSWGNNPSATLRVDDKTPSDLTATDVTYAAATIGWTSDATAWNLRYRPLTITEANFSDGTPSGWDRKKSGDDYWIKTPNITLGGTISFWAGGEGTLGSFRVYVYTGEYYTSLSQSFTVTSTRREYTVDLSGYSGTSKLAIIISDASENTADIDDITIVEPDSWTTINNVTNPYTLGGLTVETDYEAQVQAVIDEAATEWSDPVMFKTKNVVPTDVTVTPASQTATVSWSASADSYELRYGVIPENAVVNQPSTWLQYDNGAYVTNYSTTGAEQEYTWGVMYPGSQIAGNVLTKVAVYENGNNTGDITVKIYSGGDNAPGTLLYTETFASVKSGFHEVTLTSPVTITPGENLWITLTETAQYPFTCSESTDPNSRWVYSGSSWYKMNIGDRGWMIRGYIETRDLGDDDVEWTTVSCTDNTYTLTGLTAEKDYVVQVRGIYGSDTKTSWVQKTFTTTAAPVPGDANGDGEVNVTDIMAVANFILGIAMENFNEEAANVNGDGDVNVTDIMGIANIILGVNTSSSRVVQETDMAEPQ